MSSSKNSLKSSLMSNSKSSFFKANVQTDMMETQCSNFSDDREGEDSKYIDFMLEQDCLIKLKQQRQKIEQLTYLYEKSYQTVQKQQQIIHKFQLQLQTFDELKTVKLRYFALSKQFQTLFTEKSQIQNQNQNLKKKIFQLNNQYQNVIKSVSYEKRKQKQENDASVNHYQQLLRDKQGQIRRNLNVYETKETQYMNEIHNLNQIIKQLKNDINESSKLHQSQLSSLDVQLDKREASIQKLKNSIQNLKEQTSMLRQQLKSLQDQFFSKEEQWIQTQDQMMHEINSLKRKCSDFQHMLTQKKYMSQQLQKRQREAKQLIQTLKHQLKCLQQESSQTLQKLTHSYQQKLSSQSSSIQQLKDSLKQLLQVKQMFNKQNEMLKQRVGKQEQQKRRRRLMMRSQLREIEMMDNAVRRVQ